MPTRISAKEITITETPLIVDVRSQDEFLREHIPGSQNIPLEKFPNAVEPLKRNEKLIISCRSGIRAEQACAQLERIGFSNLFLLEGGLLAWKKAGQPTSCLKKGPGIMQQVQIIVGTMILTGFFYKPFWFLIPLAGIGMLTAGLTNTCMMAILLSKMPWNKINTKEGSCISTEQCNHPL